MIKRTIFSSYTRYYAYCPNCGREHGYIGVPVFGERTGCDCGTILVVNHEKTIDTGWQWYLEEYKGQIVNP